MVAENGSTSIGTLSDVTRNAIRYPRNTHSPVVNPQNKIPVRIWFSDFWPGFDYYNNYFLNLLSNKYNISLSSKPDYLIHSVFGKEYLKYKCFRICYTGENTRPDFKSNDFNIGFDYNDNPYYLRWPLFLVNGFPELLLRKSNPDATLKSKRRFCTFVASNENAKERIELFHILSKYKTIDSGGNTLNNIGYCVHDKIEFLQSGKFSIAFENASYPGYTTEKIYDVFITDSIPIYWGNPKIDRDFNSKSFINANDFENWNDLANYVIKVDKDDTLYKRILSEPRFVNNKIPKEFEVNTILRFFDQVFQCKGVLDPVANYRDYYYYYYYKCINMQWKARYILSQIRKKMVKG